MQTFYEELATSVAERDPSLNWLARVREASKEQIDVLQESVLAWWTWY
jgi:hypothetical protein